MKEKLVYYYKKLHIWYILLIASLYCIKLLMYMMSSKINNDWHIINMKVDDLIPFCKYFIFFYFTYYWFPPLQLWIISFQDKRKFYRMLISAAITCVACNIVFLCYQVKMIRPIIIGNDLFDNWVKWLYNIDGKAMNCFPSIHAVMGTLMIIGGCKTDKMPKWFNIVSIIFGVGCIVSTVFIKQHYFIDMVFGVIFMIIFYLLVLYVDKKIEKRKNIKTEV